MSQHIERRTPASQAGVHGTGPQNLVDLMYEGFYALFLLTNSSRPRDKDAFAEHMIQFLGDVDRMAKALGIPADDVTAAKYAFCATVDEIILASQPEIREAWATRPLQLKIFGDQLAGEYFFNRLEDLRARGSANLQALEVYHMCLLLGFQGRFALDGPDKLAYLTARLGDEIARMRGKSRGFAPHGERPDHVVNKLRTSLSTWALMSVFALSVLCAYVGIRASLAHETATALASYNDLVKLPPQAANVTITLP